MDPWLEDPIIWPGVHSRLVIYIADRLQALLGKRYVAAVEERVYISTLDHAVIPNVSLRKGGDQAANHAATALLEPDDAVVVEIVEDEAHEPFVQILDLRTQRQVVTVIEVVSSSNKGNREGRDLYLEKQHEVLRSSANLVEIDLLRAGPYVLGVPQGEVQQLGHYDYLVAVSRARDRHKRWFLYPRLVRDRLPRVAIPLQPTDEDVTLDLQPLIDQVYDTGIYAERLDYSKPCIPRLRPDDETWAQEQVRAWRARIQV
jgi:hypothetical protein